jgi:hypothetical protein
VSPARMQTLPTIDFSLGWGAKSGDQRTCQVAQSFLVPTYDCRYSPLTDRADVNLLFRGSRALLASVSGSWDWYKNQDFPELSWRQSGKRPEGFGATSGELQTKRGKTPDFGNSDRFWPVFQKQDRSDTENPRRFGGAVWEG